MFLMELAPQPTSKTNGGTFLSKNAQQNNSSIHSIWQTKKSVGNLFVSCNTFRRSKSFVPLFSLELLLLRFTIWVGRRGSKLTSVQRRVYWYIETVLFFLAFVVARTMFLTNLWRKRVYREGKMSR